MFSKFLNLSKDKQDRIINAALQEFALKGYQNASTNEIVKQAGISKGLLFHYFNNKKDLYLFLFDYFIEMLMEEIHAHIDWEQRDIFIKYRNVAILKFGLFQKYPNAFEFIKRVYPEDSSEVKPDLENRKKEFLNKGYKDLFGDIDLTPFKEGIDIEKAVNIIYWTMEGLAYRLQAQTATVPVGQIQLEDIIAELDVYSEMLRHSFYQ
ncbi:TetR/AcrR family transcriptional regulator [Paenibacillus sp. P46E]|uniref:TetR/AcrR family transcriptional regulator n=1 Tax=Paenibacillus sp. P46E TaxID=1349436 RepID=UPI00093B2A0C|nr:TetR family transcriptional regulator [Paenibacillus sp. P46E]